MIPIYFDKLYRYERREEPVSIAIPFKKGSLKSIDKLAVIQNEKPVMIQPKVTSYHEDGSVRYLFVRFLADLPANKSEEVLLDTDFNKQCSFKGAVVETTENGFFVNLQGMCFSVKNNSKSVFEMVDDGNRIYNADNFMGPFLESDKACYNMGIDEWRIVEEGPVCVILAGRGSNTFEENRVDFEIRVTGYVGKPWLELSYRIINTTDDELKIKSLVFYFRPDSEKNVSMTLKNMDFESGTDSTGCGDKPTDNSQETGPVFHTRGTGELSMIEEKTPVEKVRTIVGSSNYKTDFYIAREANEVNKYIDDQYLVKEANEHFAEVLYGTFFADYTDASGGVAITVFQAQQNYPKAIKAYEGGIAVMLVPEGIGNVVMQSGMAKEQSMLLHFHSSDETILEIDNRSLIYQMPDRPCVAPAVFKDAMVGIDVYPKNLIDEVEIALINKADNHSRCYGFINWGDSVDEGYTKQGRGNGKAVWSNNEYDYPHAVALMYSRTGVRRFLDYLLVSGKHQMDIDVCHYSKNPLYYKGQWEHTAGHCKNGLMVCSHEWVEGLIDYYHFTGDERAMETAIGIGDNVLRLLDTPMYQKPGEANARETGWALRTLLALYIETRDDKWQQKCDWIINSFKVWEEEYGNWLAPYTDNTAIRVGFMISVAVGSVMRYYRVFPSEEVKNMILRAVDDLIDNCMLDNGLFYYKELPSLSRNGNNTLLLESLAIAYELTKDSSYLKAGINTFAYTIRGTTGGAVGSKRIEDDAVIVAGASTKNFAQSFIPLVTYYRALGEAGLLDEVRSVL